MIRLIYSITQNIFKKNKRIILFLIEENIMIMDEYIVKKIIENRAKRFKQSYAIYAETKLLDDLDTLQKILCCNFLNGLDDALTELEKVDDASNSSNVNDITENIFDFSKESEDDEDEI